MEEGVSLREMLPFLSRYLGHQSTDDTFYYYHQISEAFQIIRDRDKTSGFVIPEVTGHEWKKILFFSKTLDFLERYLPEQSLKSRNTIETHRDALTVFRRYVTDTMNLSLRTFGFEECTHEFLLLYIEFLHKNGNSENTCNNRLAAIRAYLWYAADCDISLQSAALTASQVPFLKVPKLTREVIPDDALKALLSAPPDTKIGRRDKLILILLYDSAVRVSELLSMNVSSVNLEISIPYLRFKINNVIFIFFYRES